jgi:WD40 repeat protein
MQRSLADRLSRAVVGCYPPRWKQRYAAELLDVLDQHRAGPRTVLSLAGGALSSHLDPDYRIQVRVMPRLTRDAKLAIALLTAVIVGVPALVILPLITKDIRESRWQPSDSDSVAAIAFSRDQRTMVSASNGPPWEATSTLWDVASPARAVRFATLAGPRDTFTALAFSSRGNLLAGVTYHGSVLVFRVAGPGPAARDTVLTWQVAGSGDLSDHTTIFRDVSDAQPALAPGARIVADGPATGGEVHLWALPGGPAG